MPQSQPRGPGDVEPAPDDDMENVNDTEIEEDEDEVFGAPPGSDLDDPADDDW